MHTAAVMAALALAVPATANQTAAEVAIPEAVTRDPVPDKANPAATIAFSIPTGGVDIRVIQALLGHAKLNTTAFYTQVATKTVRAVVSPLDRLALAAPDKEAPSD